MQTRYSGKKLWNLLQALLSDYYKLQATKQYLKLLTATFLQTVFTSKATHAVNQSRTEITSQISTCVRVY